MFADLTVHEYVEKMLSECEIRFVWWSAFR